LLETTYEQCSSVLKVLNSDGVFQTIPRGEWMRVNLSDPRFRWLCGDSISRASARSNSLAT
jgi:hypothetical protein